MFRYLGLVWDPADENASTTAGRIVAHGPSGPWRTALQRPGMQVWVAGERPGGNRSQGLADRHGVLLGTVFRRRHLLDGGPMAATLDAAEQQRILASTGRALVDEFWGRSVAIFSTPDGRSHIVRDASGTLPCFLMAHEGVWIVFSRLDDVFATIPRLPPPRISWDGVGAHLLCGAIGGPETVLAGVSQVLPGEVLHLGRTDVRRELLWDPVGIARRPALLDEPAARLMLRETVRGCVRAWASCYDSLVLRLSGGVDSSILCGCLDRCETAARVTLLNYFSAGTNADERSFARLAAARAGRRLIELEDDPSVLLERLFDTSLSPFPEGYLGRIGTATPDAATARQHGAGALFTGAGGDALFYEFRRWWPAADYLHVRGVDRGFLAGAMDAARLGKLSVWRTLRLAVGERLRPTRCIDHPGRHLTLVEPAALPGPEIHRRFVHPLLWGRIDLPLGKLNQLQQLMLPLACDDPFEQDAAPEIVNPLLSQPLVELALTIPTYTLTRGGQGRSLARRAFADILPPEIAARRSKGGANDFARSVLRHNLPFARSLLLDGQLVARGYLRRARVVEALSDRPSTLAIPVSEIHAMIALEVWLTRWQRRAAAPA